MRKKTVQVLGHEFDACPAYTTVAGKGSGSSLSIAVRRAIDNMFADPRLHHRQIGTFKLSVVVTAETTKTRASANIYIDAPAAKTAAEHTGNCGECLMTHADVVPLRADGSCPCCQVNHAKGAA